MNLHPDASGTDAYSKDAFWTQKEKFWTPKKGLRTLSKEDLTGHTQKKEHFVTYAKKSAFFQKPFFLERQIKEGHWRLKVYLVIFGGSRAKAMP